MNIEFVIPVFAGMANLSMRASAGMHKMLKSAAELPSFQPLSKSFQ